MQCPWLLSLEHRMSPRLWVTYTVNRASDTVAWEQVEALKSSLLSAGHTLHPVQSYLPTQKKRHFFRGPTRGQVSRQGPRWPAETYPWLGGADTEMKMLSFQHQCFLLYLASYSALGAKNGLGKGTKGKMPTVERPWVFGKYVWSLRASSTALRTDFWPWEIGAPWVASYCEPQEICCFSPDSERLRSLRPIAVV